MGEPMRLFRVALLTLTLMLIPILVGWAMVIATVHTAIDAVEEIDLLHLVSAPVALGAVIVAFIGVAGVRAYLLKRSGRFQSPVVCALSTVRDGLVLVAKSMLILYFVILLGQLPFRAALTEKLHAQLVNEVQAVENWHAPTSGVDR